MFIIDKKLLCLIKQSVSSDMLTGSANSEERFVRRMDMLKVTRTYVYCYNNITHCLNITMIIEIHRKFKYRAVPQTDNPGIWLQWWTSIGQGIVTGWYS